MRGMNRLLLSITALLPAPMESALGIEVRNQAIVAETVSPFVIRGILPESRGLQLDIEPAAYEALKSGSPRRTLRLPIGADDWLTIEAQRFEVVSPTARFVNGTPAGDQHLSKPDVILLRGSVRGEPGSHFFLGLSQQGGANGYVVRSDGSRYVVSHPRSTSSAIRDGYDVVFGPDGALYVASFGDDRVVRIDVDMGTISDFVPAGAGGLNGPAALIFGSDGHLYVSSNLTNSVLRFDGSTGAALGSFVLTGAGGLTGPFGLTFGFNGNLFVAGSDNSVREYDGDTGAFVGTFVAPGSGGLSGSRGLLFTPDGRLLVTSHDTHDILEYSMTGTFLRIFNGVFSVTNAWGLRLGPNGNVFVMRSGGAIRVLEFDVDSGLYVRSFIRGDPALVSPTGFAFRPTSPNDCNQNTVPDDCDLASGFSQDGNADGVPDECACVTIPYGDLDDTGVVDVGDVLCALDGFSDPQSCDADIAPCGGDGVIDVGDILAVLSAFSGQPTCPDSCE